MNSKIISLTLLVAASGILVTSLVTAKKMATITLAPALMQIISSQKAMDQKLAAIDNKLTLLQSGLRAGAGRFGNMPPAAPRPPAEDPNKVYSIDKGSSVIKGNENARVMLVEFSDFQCPYSQKFHPIVEEVLKSYPNDVKFMFKNFPLPFHPQARPAVKASFAAREQGKYWEMVEALFQNGRELSEEKFKELAKNLGLDVDKFMRDYKEKDAEWEKLIAQDMDAVRSAEAGGTPSFYINGKKVIPTGPGGYSEAFKETIDKILKGPDSK